MRSSCLLTIWTWLGLCRLLQAEEARPSVTSSPDPHFVVSTSLARDDFTGSFSQWRPELEKGGTTLLRNDALDIDVPGGCTIWFKRPFEGPLLISYDATVVQAGGPNDRASDLNCFWMARDARTPEDLFASKRTGKFADYDTLNCYYVGLGGNSNTTTRFRRYIGQAGNRPLLPEHDLSAREFLIVPNTSQTIQLVAAGSTIAYYRDGKQIFSYEDPHPYASGWFGFRTTASHLQIRNFSVSRLESKP